MPAAIIVYETNNGVTKTIASAIREGMEEAGIKPEIKKIDEVTAAELADYQAVILGAPTYHKDIIETMKDFLSDLEKVNLKGKTGAVFGAYGWSGKSHQILSETMSNVYGMKMVDPGVKLAGTGGETGLSQHRTFGKKIAAQIKMS